MAGAPIRQNCKTSLLLIIQKQGKPFLLKKTETYRGASGVVLRNEQGQFIAAKYKQHELIPDALTIEAYAYHDAVLLIKDLRLTKVIIETDCQELVALWNSRATNRCVVIPLLNQI